MPPFSQVATSWAGEGPTLQVVLSSDFGLETKAGHVTLPGRFRFWSEELEDKTKTPDTLVTVQECRSFRQP